MYRNSVYTYVAVSLTLLAPLVAFSHHSPNAYFDSSDIVMIAGEVVEVDWANPHSTIKVISREEGQGDSEWLIETNAVAFISREGITRDAITEGDSVQVAGWRGRRNKNAIYLTNILLADGREWIARRSAEPVWTDNLVDTASAVAQLVTSDYQSGIFQVWALARSLWNEDYPLTDAARQTQARWDGVADNPYLYCQNGMPAIMDTTHPIEFLREGDNILLRFEELDARRVIVMGNPDSGPTDTGSYGKSTGRWEDNSLIVRTTEIDWPWFDQEGIPQSDSLEIVESFTATEDGMFLDYRATLTDPVTFSEPVVLERRWVSVPGVEIQEYECRWDDAVLRFE